MKMLDVPQSGSLAGQTSSRNRYGQYRRTRATPVNPNSNYQTNARNALGNVSAAWKALTDVQREGWEACAAEYPIVDSLGQTVVLTGAAQFVRANSARLRIGLTILDEPQAATPWGSNQGGILITNGATPTLSVSFTPPPDGQYIAMDFSPQLSPGINYWSDFRRLYTALPASTSPIALYMDYTLKFGPLIAGKKIILRMKVMNECGIWGPERISWAFVPEATGTLRAAGRAGAKAPARSQGKKGTPAESVEGTADENEE